jgi:hypothetical protein
MNLDTGPRIKTQTITPLLFLDPTHRNTAATNLSQGIIDGIELSVHKKNADILAAQLATLLQTTIYQQKLTELQSLNMPLGRLQLDAALKPLLFAEAARTGTNINPFIQSLSTEIEVKHEGDAYPRKVLEGAVLGASVSALFNGLSNSSGNPVLVTLGLMAVGAVLWPHANSIEAGIKSDGSIYGKIGL